MIENKNLICVIIPVINEEKVINQTIDNLIKYRSIEIIFVDGGSQDKTVEIIENSGLKVISAPRLYRSARMNLGAKQAQGNILLFLHGDTVLPEQFPQIIDRVVTQKDFVAGAFRLQIDSPKQIYRWLERLVTWRSQFLSLPYGDQAIFLTKKQFEEVDGFDNLKIMEDFSLVKKLQKKGKIYLTSEAVVTSARRWENLGVFTTTIINQLMITGYYLGVPDDKLAKFYRQIKKQL